MTEDDGMDLKPIHFLITAILAVVFCVFLIDSCETEKEPPAGPKPSLMIQSV
jgi:hypothetical protein